MNEFDYNHGGKSNPTSKNENHANDDDLYAASLIDQVRKAKSSRNTRTCAQNLSHFRTWPNYGRFLVRVMHTRVLHGGALNRRVR